MFEDSNLIDHVVRAQALVMEGDRAGAQTLLEGLWTTAIQAGDHYGACIAAHFLAHAHADPTLQRDWHLRALEAADAVAGARVQGFYPSLYANLAEVYLRLGEPGRSRTYIDRAQAVASLLPEDSYGRMIRSLIDRIISELIPIEADG